jgi:hypothetical protein
MTKPKAASEKKGGRKSASTVQPELADNFLDVVKDHTAGDPARGDVIWTYLSTTEIARELEKLGTPASPDTVRNLLEEFGFHRRQAEKNEIRTSVAFRDEQFENIAHWKAKYLHSPNPIVSMDTKRRELIGNFFRPGTAYATGPNPVWDHDFRRFASGTVIPHGLFDVKRNVGHITLGTSHDTSLFACDCIRGWWRRYGAAAWPKAKSILLLCDSGGSNNCRQYLFKEELQRVVNAIGLPIRVAHYPTYCSKYNPIEHRLFPHIARAWKGLVFRSLAIVTAGLRRVSTSRGLKVTYRMLDKVYELRRKVTRRFLDALPIRFDDFLPQWNYVVVPTNY